MCNRLRNFLNKVRIFLGIKDNCANATFGCFHIAETVPGQPENIPKYCSDCLSRHLFSERRYKAWYSEDI